MGPNGRATLLARFNGVGSGTKTPSVVFGGTSGLSGYGGLAGGMNANLTGGMPLEVCNKNSNSLQEFFPQSGSVPYGFSGNGTQFGAFNTVVNQYMGVVLNLGAATDALILASYIAEVCYGA